LGLAHIARFGNCFGAPEIPEWDHPNGGRTSRRCAGSPCGFEASFEARTLLGVGLKDAYPSGLYAMQRFARTLRRDIDAVRNALTEHWSNGQTEAQINRLKTLKRAVYGRAGPELLRARMLPL